MAANGQLGKCAARRIRLVLLGCGWAAAWLIAAGCQSMGENKNVPTGDPLMGEKAWEKPSIGPTPPPQNRANMAVPPGPQATASKSITSMVAPDPLLGGKAFGITDPNVQPAQTVGGWIPKDKQPGAPSVVIKAPELPAIQPVPPPTVNFGGAAAPPFADYDQLMAALKARGALWTNQQGVAGGVRFSCGLPNPQDPNYVQVFEATAADYRSAVVAVLQKIDQPR